MAPYTNMPPITLASLLQLILALGLLNVWLLRRNKPTSYRGGSSASLPQEFAAYGLPTAVYFGVGALKLGAAAALIAGLWIPELALPAASVLAVLMVGALAMHVRVHDPLLKSVPAFSMLAMTSTLAALKLG